VYLSEEHQGGNTYRDSAIVAWAGASLSALVASVVLLRMNFSYGLVAIGALLIVFQAQMALWRALSVRHGRLMRPALTMAFGAGFRVIAISGLFALGLLTVASSFAVVQGAVVLGALLFLAPVVFANRGSRSSRMTRERFRTLVATGSPVLLFHACTTVTLNANLFLLNGRISPRELGVFAASMALANASLSLSGAFRSRVQAAFYAPEPVRQVRREFVISAAVASTGAIIASALSPLIVHVFLGAGYESAVAPLRVLFIASGVLILMDCVHGALAIVVKRPAMVLIAASGATALLSATLLLTPVWGLLGASVATLLGYSTVAVIGFITIFRRLRLPS